MIGDGYSTVYGDILKLKMRTADTYNKPAIFLKSLFHIFECHAAPPNWKRDKTVTCLCPNEPLGKRIAFFEPFREHPCD